MGAEASRARNAHLAYAHAANMSNIVMRTARRNMKSAAKISQHGPACGNVFLSINIYARPMKVAK